MNSSAGGAQSGAASFPLPSTWVLGPTASLGPACPAKGLPRPPRKHLEPLGSDGPCHGTPLPTGAAKLPPFLAPLLPDPVLPTCFQDPVVPWRPLPGQSPKPLGRSQAPLNRRHPSIHPTAKNTLSSGMCEAPTPNCQGLLLSRLYENWGAMEQTREESVCPCMRDYVGQQLQQQLCVQRLHAQVEG